jgi:methyl-accepting chemotaxis protein
MKVKLISALLLLLIVCLAGFTMFSLRRSESMIRTKELESYQFLVKTVRSAMQQKFHEAETAAHTLAHNPDIQRLFAERKREELSRLLLPVYQALKPAVSQLHFHLPDSRSFLRLHFPEEFGDDLHA